MTAHVFIELIKRGGKRRDKMRGLPTILSLFRNKFNKFNNTGAGMFDSFYHMTLKLLLINTKNAKILPYILVKKF